MFRCLDCGEIFEEADEYGAMSDFLDMDVPELSQTPLSSFFLGLVIQI